MPPHTATTAAPGTAWEGDTDVPEVVPPSCYVTIRPVTLAPCCLNPDDRATVVSRSDARGLHDLWTEHLAAGCEIDPAAPGWLSDSDALAAISIALRT